MRRRLRLEIQGSVQGVGFRPFVHRLAQELRLGGWVVNDSRGVTLEVEGETAPLHRFAERVRAEAPRASTIETVDHSWLAARGDADDFEILDSQRAGRKTVQVLPDLACCPECVREILDPVNRRHAYPFTNCTQCGPRFSIVRSLPYDRPRTTMLGFTMCEQCRTEYDDPDDRRFHAQPNACPACGPQLALWSAEQVVLARGHEALVTAARCLTRGGILAVKGLGGFHLMVDARDEAAVCRLRRAKPRREKPFALMVRDLEQARELCELNERDADLLTSAEAPMLLLRRRDDASIADGVAPANPYLGVMLPYTPLHHLLMERVGLPVVATSGNLSDEPICTDEREAAGRLYGVADEFLVHDRPIARHVDDSVAWSVAGEPRLLRRARGYAPRPVSVPEELPVILALGGHLKNTVALSVGRRVFVSQHIGDMETPQALEAFERVIADFLRLYETAPVAVAHDLHPDYATTRWALDPPIDRLRGLPRIGVQHHHAHLAACLAEHGAQRPALGAIWDGTGYGTDGVVWGGEFLVGNATGYRRFASLRPFALPGGEAAVREPRRVALSLLWELGGESAADRDELAAVRAFDVDERRLLCHMLRRELSSPRTTSLGRLFDGVAAMLDLCQHNSFEGQAAMMLEHAACPDETASYPFEIARCVRRDAADAPEWTIDWGPTVEAVLDDLRRDRGTAKIAARFHNTWIDVLLEVAGKAGEQRVALSGGCFQNRRLVEHAVERMRSDGFQPLLHRQVPPNDGGISLGQLHVAAARLAAGVEGGAPCA